EAYSSSLMGAHDPSPCHTGAKSRGWQGEGTRSDGVGGAPCCSSPTCSLCGALRGPGCAPHARGCPWLRSRALGLSPHSLHGSPLTDAGLALLNPALSIHPSLVALDLGDCMLGDEGINLICGLLPPDGAKSGLKELTLSANPGVTAKGWGRLAIAVAHSSQLRVLNLDYNPLGDQVAGMLAVAVASSRTLEVLDLEGTGLTNQSAQTLLDMVENYPTALRTLILAENNISPELQQQISDLLSEGEEEEEIEAREVTAREKNPWISQTSHSLISICSADSSSQMVLMTSGLGDSLLAETEM
uniref:Leucine rich repeat containing 73 n=1 Tax=Crocodylus porosus TaxID=8502 RepID=A0A7M4F1W0_CROPO